jgi:hypothetical protein
MRITINITQPEADAIREHLTAAIVGGQATKQERDTLCNLLTRVLKALPARKAKTPIAKQSPSIARRASEGHYHRD